MLGPGSLAVAGQGGNLAREGTVLWCDPRFLAPVSPMEQATHPGPLQPWVENEGRVTEAPRGCGAAQAGSGEGSYPCPQDTPSVWLVLLEPWAGLCEHGALRFGSGSRQPVWETNPTKY